MYFLYLKTREFIEWLPMGSGTRIEARLLLKHLFCRFEFGTMQTIYKSKF